MPRFRPPPPPSRFVTPRPRPPEPPAPDLPGDSEDYEVLAQAVALIGGVPGMTCEIGLRRGGGTRVIVDALVEHGIRKTHIAIDPYGNIEYRTSDQESTRLDYTNRMRDEALPAIYRYCMEKGIHFVFFNLEDVEFFARFADGVPVYAEHKTLEREYALVHFDGPHDVASLAAEIAFFAPRTPPGGAWVFDDIHNYDHATLHERHILPAGFEHVTTVGRKALYRRAG
jgi:hypothetical protein